MDTPSDPTSAREILNDVTHERLAAMTQQLKAAKKTLARDWSHLSPRERSAQSRLVKELEQQQQALLEAIAMHRPS